MEFKKGTPKKLGMYAVWSDGSIDLVRVANSQATGYKIVECMHRDGSWFEQTFPASATFSPRLRQARGYSEAESVEQGLDQRLRNANVALAAAKAELRTAHERNSALAAKAVPQRKPVILTAAMSADDALMSALKAAGVAWTVDMHEQTRNAFIETWDSKFPEMKAEWLAAESRFSRDCVEMSWQMHKAFRGIR